MLKYTLSYLKKLCSGYPSGSYKDQNYYAAYYLPNKARFTTVLNKLDNYLDLIWCFNCYFNISNIFFLFNLKTKYCKMLFSTSCIFYGSKPLLHCNITF